ncbi:hypothetical protein WME89_46110 [Sorangium sp. So ce321]|uniref:hypothetical protein n=1 Tax=Sorangium sp. So ce321 TaxID=3133300 RepID=UPI003F629627
MKAHRLAWVALLLVAAQVPFVTACSGAVDGSGDPEPDTGTDPSGEGGGGGASAPETAPDLFACGLELSCDKISRHLAAEPREALECAARLLLSGGGGVLSALDTPGPFIDETESLIVVLGDGTALVQTRERHCGAPDEPPCQDDTWEAPSLHQICDVEIPASMEEACEEDSEEGCVWVPWSGLSNCQAVDDATCDDIADRLAPR